MASSLLDNRKQAGNHFRPLQFGRQACFAAPPKHSGVSLIYCQGTRTPPDNSGKLPLSAARLRQDSPKQTGDDAAHEPIKVLLVEDEPGDAELVKLSLRSDPQSQYQIMWACSLTEAKAHLADAEFDVILLDLSLPDSFGIETVENVRRLNQQLPLIVLTGSDDVQFALSALGAGASDYLVKGDFGHSGLARTIHYALHRAELETHLKENNARLALAGLALESAAEAIYVTDDQGIIESVNPSFCTTTGYSSEEAVGKSTKLLNSGLHSAEFYKTFWDSLLDQGAWYGEIWNRRKNGEIYPQWLSIRAVRDDADEQILHYVAVSSDLTVIRQAERQAEQLLKFDVLTGLPNREHFNQLLEQALHGLNRSGRQGAVLILNMRRFREFNEAFGILAGDELLQAFAKRLQDNLSKKDYIARLGADEFIALLHDLDPTPEIAARHAFTIANRLLENLSQSFIIAEKAVSTEACIGINLFSKDTGDVASIIDQAHVALSRIKKQANQNIGFFENSMGEIALNRYQLQQELRTGVTEQQLRLYLQPQFDSANQIVSFEALVRWQHPQRGMVSPAEFIPIAESSGLIVAVDTWMLEQVCQLIVEMTQKDRPLPIAVNISARHFQSADFVSKVLNCVRKNKIDPQLIILEVTESLFLHSLEAASIKMKELVASGFRFSLDDFGTGYSSLSYLKNLPFYELKIDQSFIRDLQHNPEDKALIETIVAIARTMKLHVIAEGVETAEQAAFLRTQGAISQQGYFFGKPESWQNWIERV